MKTREAVLQQLNSLGAKKVKVAVADIDGVLRGKVIHIDKFQSALDGGIGFCNVVFGWDSGDVCYDNVRYTGWHTGYPDAHVRLDTSTFRQIPWDNGIPFFLGEFVTDDGKPLAVCPRQLVKRIVEKSKAQGFTPYVGMEFEWFNFRETPQTLQKKNFVDPEPLTPGMFGYSLLRSSQEGTYFAALNDWMREFNVPIEGIHTETGPGVYEAAITVTDALEAADRAVLFKTAAKEIALRHGIIATFMARWNTRLPGCSGHIHQSLKRADGTNAFYDAADAHKMSDIYKQYLAGQLHCLPEILPMFAPTVNSYKRLVEGYWAPTRSSWGIDNRTTAMRVIPGSEKSTRLETRVPGADVNPYLGISAALASGLYGMEKKLPLNEPLTVGNAYASNHGARLPRTLLEAAERFGQSPVAHELFGREFVEHFAQTRIWEWREFQKSVTDWELKRYFEII